jgi:hypothetical protein
VIGGYAVGFHAKPRFTKDISHSFGAGAPKPEGGAR